MSFTAAQKEVLSTSRTYYVRGDGNDANTGLVNSSGGAFLTIQHALDIIAYFLDVGNNSVTVQCAAGTYAGGSLFAPVIGGQLGGVILLGDATIPANCIISTTGVDAVAIANPGVFLTVDGFKLMTSGSGNCLAAGTGATLQYRNIEFGACANAHIVCYDSFIYTDTPNKISGNALYHWLVVDNGQIAINGNHVITLTGTPAFSQYFAFVENNSNIDMAGTTFSGSATGARYHIINNSTIETGSGTPTTFLPGNAAGSTASGGFIVN